MLAGDDAARVGQGPIEMCVAADVESTPLHFDPQRAAVGKTVQILDGESKRHSSFK